MILPRTRHLKKLVLALGLACTPALHAGNFVFHIDLNVAGLIGKPNSPFFLDFQLNQGSSTLANNATLSNFTFTGGLPSGSANNSPGSSGDLASSISLTDGGGNNFVEFNQGFSATTTDIQFNVSLTQNPGANPDGFSASILDSEAGNPPIGTTAPDTSSLVTVALKSSNSLSDVKTYSSTAPDNGAVATATAIPEPGSVAALVAGLGVLVMLQRRRRSAA